MLPPPLINTLLYWLQADISSVLALLRHAPLPVYEAPSGPADGMNLANYDNVMALSVFELPRCSFDAIIAAYDWFEFIRFRYKLLAV